MKYEIEKLKGQVKISYTVSESEWNDEINGAYVKTKYKYNIPGFRKGKIPRKVIETYYGQSVFFDEAFNSVASKSYSQSLKENTDIFPVDDPKVDIQELTTEENKELKFTMTVTVKPEFTLGQYKDLKLNKAEYPVTQKEVDEEIKNALSKASRLVKIEDRAVLNGDTVNLNYSGSVDGVKFDGGTADKQTLVIGSNSFIPGFEEQMVGMKIGETKDLKVKFPDDYSAENLKGKDAIFSATVNEISFNELPVLDDNFVKDTSKFNTVKEYKDDVENRLKEQSLAKAERENQNNLVDTIVGATSIDIPQCMIDEEVNYMLEDFEYRLKYMYQGMSIDDYFKYTNSSKEDFKKERAEEAKKSVKTRLVLQELIKAEKIEVNDADMDAFIAKIAKNAGKTFEEYKATLDAHKMEHMKSDALVTKTLDTLASFNSFEKKEGKAKKAVTNSSETDETTKKSPSAKKTTVKAKNE